MDIAGRPRAAWPPHAADVALAIGLIFAFSEPGFDSYHHDSGSVWAVAGTLGAASLAWRRVAPRAVWLVTTVTGTWLLVMRHGPDWGGLSPLVLIPSALAGLYSLAARSERRAGQCAAAVTFAALEAGLLAHRPRPEAVVTVAALTVIAWLAGDTAQARARLLAAERAARELRAAAAERARIAAELHDIVAHHVSVISLQAGTARLLAQAGTPPDADLLAGIETASRQAMTELRLALGVIRHSPGGTEPPPGLSRIPALAAGTGLTVTVDGNAVPAGEPGDGGAPAGRGTRTLPARALPAAVELTAYRVVQESLTNVLRHSAARAARVTLRLTDGALRVTVTDDGPARQVVAGRGTRAEGGQGLRGLRERVAAHGGTFSAGPRDGGATPGFEVRAALPVPEGATAEPGPATAGARPAAAGPGPGPAAGGSG